MITPSFGLTATERVLPKLALDFTTASLDSRVTFTRSGNTATVINSVGQIAPINANLPRFDYNLGTGGACKGLLIEEARTNLLVNSLLAGAVAGSPGTAPTNWSIGFGSGATSSLATSIYGVLDSAQAITFSGTAIRMMYQQTINVTAGQQYALSAYLESVTGSIGDFLFATNGTATVVMNTFATSPTVTGRYTVLFTASTTGTCTIRIGIGTSGTPSGAVAATFSRPQVEAGSFSTSYIPTTTAGTVTRNADVATMTGTNFSDWYNQTQGTFVATFDKYVTNTVGALWWADDGSSANVIDMVAHSIAKLVFEGITTSVYGGNITSGTLVANTKMTGVSAYSSTTTEKASLNGVAATAGSLTLPSSGLTRTVLGSQGNSLAYLNGHLYKMAYYPQALTAAEVQAFSK